MNMEKRKKRILVPYDFTDIGDCALEHAIVFAQNTDFELNILHVIEKPTIYIGKNSKFDNELITEATVTRLQKLTNKIDNEHGIIVQAIAKPGNIFETINDVSDEIGANMVIMGTHGVKGFNQLIRGSNALRVIYDSKVPFMIVQKRRPIGEDYKNIVFPVDFQRETKEKAYWAVYISRMFDSKIHIIHPTETDEGIAKKIANNITYVKKIFDANKVKYSEKKSPKKAVNLGDETLDYSKEINAHLIMIMTYPDKGSGGATEFFLSPEQQDIITNKEEIPIMCINPRDNLYLSGSIKTSAI